MLRTLGPALLAALLFAPAAFAAEPDKAVARHLDTLGYPYEVDEDGDYRMVFDMDNDRTQLVYVRSVVEEFGANKVREVWSPGYQSSTDAFPQAVANRLLEDSQDAKMGGWVKQERIAMFVVKLDADAPSQALGDAISAATRTADAMELELTRQDEY
jgi:hypothetical protein